MDTLHTNSKDAKDLNGDIADLKRDVGTLMKHLKIGIGHSAEAAGEQIDEEAHKFYDGVAQSGRQSVKAIDHQIHQHPLTAALILVGVGFIGARLTMR